MKRYSINSALFIVLLDTDAIEARNFLFLVPRGPHMSKNQSIDK